MGLLRLLAKWIVMVVFTGGFAILLVACFMIPLVTPQTVFLVLIRTEDLAKFIPASLAAFGVAATLANLASRFQDTFEAGSHRRKMMLTAGRLLCLSAVAFVGSLSTISAEVSGWLVGRLHIAVTGVALFWFVFGFLAFFSALIDGPSEFCSKAFDPMFGLIERLQLWTRVGNGRALREVQAASQDAGPSPRGKE